MLSFDDLKMLIGSVEVNALLLTSMMLRFRGKFGNGPLNLFSASKRISSFDNFVISVGICPENSFDIRLSTVREPRDPRDEGIGPCNEFVLKLIY